MENVVLPTKPTFLSIFLPQEAPKTQWQISLPIFSSVHLVPTTEWLVLLIILPLHLFAYVV